MKVQYEDARERLKMSKEGAPNYVESHLLEALAAGVAEAAGDDELSRQLYAKTKLRLVTMSDEQLWELARLTSAGKPVERVYESIKKVVAELIATRSEWTKDLP